MVRYPTWRGLVTGDKIRYVGHEPVWAKYYGKIFEFVYHDVNVVSGREWIMCFGGLRGYESWQGFRLDEVQPVDSRQSSG